MHYFLCFCCPWHALNPAKDFGKVLEKDDSIHSKNPLFAHSDFLICLTWMMSVHPNMVCSSRGINLHYWRWYIHMVIISIIIHGIYNRGLKKPIASDTAEDTVSHELFLECWCWECTWGSIFLNLTQSISPFLANPPCLSTRFFSTIPFYLRGVRLACPLIN